MLKFIDHILDFEEAHQSRSLFVIELKLVTLKLDHAHYPKGHHFESATVDLVKGSVMMDGCEFSMSADLSEDCACRCRGCGEYHCGAGGYCV